MSILYPVAPNGDAALNAPLGRAARQREAEAAAGQEVVFETEAVGPAFATRAAALDAYAGRLDDDRPGRTLSVAVEDQFCRLAEIAAPGGGRTRAPRPVEPTHAEGRRWPSAPPSPPATVWRLQVSYWRIASAERPIDHPQARQARRGTAGREVGGAALNSMARQPLRPVKAQQPLDIGLFEVRLPESPHIVVPDE